MAVSQEILFICFQISYGIGSILKFNILRNVRNEKHFLIGVAGNIYVGQLLGANKPEKAMNVTKLEFLLSGELYLIKF